MSFAARGFAAQQERRRRRLLLGPLLIGAQQEDSQRQAEQRTDSPAQISSRPVDGVKGETVTGNVAPSRRSHPCASQLRALAALRRLHPTAVHLAIRETAPIPGRRPAPGLSPRGISRWRKPLPWAALPPQSPGGQGAAFHDSCGATSTAPAGAGAPDGHSTSDLAWEAAEQKVQACFQDLTTAAMAVLACKQRLCRCPVERLGMELWDMHLDQDVAKALLEAQEAHDAEHLRQSLLGGGDDSAGAGAVNSGELGDLALLHSRIVAAAEADRERMRRCLQQRGWAGIEEANACIMRMPVHELKSLLQHLRPGPGPLTSMTPLTAAAASGSPGASWQEAVPGAWVERAPDRAAWSAELWGRLVCAAEAAAAGRSGAAALEAGLGDGLTVLRSAVLGLVLLEGCTGAEAGPVGLLGPPDPLACALLTSMLRFILAQIELHQLADPRIRSLFLGFFSPAHLYDILAYGQLPSAVHARGDSERPKGQCLPPPSRLSGQHLDHVLKSASRGPLGLLAQTALSRAILACEPPASVAALARALWGVYRLNVSAQAREGPDRSATEHTATADANAATTAAALLNGAAVAGSDEDAYALAEFLSAAGDSEDGGSTDSDDDLFLYDCVYLPATHWSSGACPSSPQPNPPPPPRLATPFASAARVLSYAAELGLLEADESTALPATASAVAVRQLRKVLSHAEVVVREMLRTMQAIEPREGEAMLGVWQHDAKARSKARVAAHGRQRDEWARCSSCHSALFAAITAEPVLSSTVRWVVATLRPGLLEAHPMTWGKLVSGMKAAEAMEAGREAHPRAPHGMGAGSPGSLSESEMRKEVAAAAMWGLFTLAGQHVEMLRLRLDCCVAAGACVIAHTDTCQVEDFNLSSAIGLFFFLSTVPCPLLVSPDPGWTSKALPQLPPADPSDPRVGQQRALAGLSHSLERFALFPELSNALAVAMVMQREVDELRSPPPDASELTGEGGSGNAGSAGGGDELRRRPEALELEKAMGNLLCDVAILSLHASHEQDTSSDTSDEEAEEGLQAEGEGATWHDSEDGCVEVQARQEQCEDHGDSTALDHGADGGDGGGGDGSLASTDSLLTLLGPETQPKKVVEALRQLIGCCRWLRGKIKDSSAAPPPAPPPSALLLVGPDQMLLTALFLRDAPPGPERKDYWHLVFEPWTSEALAHGVLQRGPHQQVSLFPPPRGEPGVVVLGGVQAALLPHLRQPEYQWRFEWSAIEVAGQGIVVSATSRWSTNLRDIEDALVRRRLGALWIYAVGAEGLQRALLMAAKVRDHMFKDFRTTLYVGVVAVDWPRPEEPGDDVKRRRQRRGGGDGGTDSGNGDGRDVQHLGIEAQECLSRLVEGVCKLQIQFELGDAAGMGRQSARKDYDTTVGVVERLQHEVRAGGPLRERVQFELRLMECEPGRPDRPRLPLSGKAVQKQRLKDAMRY